MPCVTVLPSGATAVEGGPSSIGAPILVGPTYVDAVTDNSDATYVQQQVSGSDFSYIRWDLPATPVPYAKLTSISVMARIAYDPTPVSGRTSVDPSTITNPASVRLRFPGDSDSLSIPWTFPMPQTPSDYSGDYNLAFLPAQVEGWIGALSAGTAQLETRQGGDSIGRSTRHNIYELALLICYGEPRLRQRQRDDLRQRQSDSRQLTARQRGYF